MEAAVRRDAVDVEREMVWLREKKRRVDAERLGGAGGDRSGDMGPRRLLSRWMAVVQSVHGWWCDSPMWPQPLLWVVQQGWSGGGLCGLLTVQGLAWLI